MYDNLGIRRSRATIEAETQWCWRMEEKFVNAVKERVKIGMLRIKPKTIEILNPWIRGNPGNARALVDPKLIAAKKGKAESKEKKSEKILKHSKEIALELHGSFQGKLKMIESFRKR